MLPTDPGDRNRTSPFAFTGNRFEFRAPGSLQSIAGPMVAINTILAEALDYIATELESLVADGADFNAAVQKVLEEIITDHGASSSTATATPRSGRSRPRPAACRTSAPRSTRCPQLVTAEAMELFSHYGVFSDREMHSRYEIALEQYALSIGVEARLDARDGDAPSSSRRRCATRPSWPPTSPACKAVGVEADTLDARRGDRRDRRRCGPASPRCAASSAHDDADDDRGRGRRTPARELLPAMAAVRAAADELEALVADDLWPLADLPGDALHPLRSAAVPTERSTEGRGQRWPRPSSRMAMAGRGAWVRDDGERPIVIEVEASPSGTGQRSPSTTCPSPCVPAWSPASSGPTAPASPPPCG